MLPFGSHAPDGVHCKHKGLTMKTSETITLTAANDNPGGATSVTVTLTSLVAVMARAYVAESRSKGAKA